MGITFLKKKAMRQGNFFYNILLEVYILTSQINRLIFIFIYTTNTYEKRVSCKLMGYRYTHEYEHISCRVD